MGQAALLHCCGSVVGGRDVRCNRLRRPTGSQLRFLQVCTQRQYSVSRQHCCMGATWRNGDEGVCSPRHVVQNMVQFTSVGAEHNCVCTLLWHCDARFMCIGLRKFAAALETCF